MLISDGRQGARFGRLLSFEHIAIKFHHFFTQRWVVQTVLGDQIKGRTSFIFSILNKKQKNMRQFSQQCKSESLQRTGTYSLYRINDKKEPL